MAANHPFDSAYGLMKSMQAQLVELRGVVQAEQQQRHQEVSQLKNEVADLRDQLHRLQGDHGAFYERVTCAMTSETALRGRAVEKLREELHEVLAQSVEVKSLKDQMASQFAKLSFELRLEKQERETGQEDISRKLHAEVTERRDSVNSTMDDLVALKKQSEANTAQDRDIMSSVAQSVQMAGHLLCGVGADTGRAAQLMAMKAAGAGAMGDSGQLAAPGTAGEMSSCSTMAPPGSAASQRRWEDSSPMSDAWNEAAAAASATS